MKRILLIDDNPMNNSIFLNSLKKHYEVDVAMYLIAATRLIKRVQYDLIIIDVMMPTQKLNWDKEMETGFFFFEKEIKPLGKNIPILFWTRLDEDSFQSYFKNKTKHNLYFLHKDSKDDNLLKKIKEIIK